MAKDKAVAPGFWQGLFRTGLYKRNQGRITRQVTLVVLGVIFGLGAWELKLAFDGTVKDVDANPGYRWFLMLLPLAVFSVGLWASFRAVNTPRFADFLIAVEAEINKVSWPSRTELVRSSLVVIFVIFALAGLLFFYDLVWQFVFSLIGVRPR